MSYWPQQPGKSGPVLSEGCGGWGGWFGVLCLFPGATVTKHHTPKARWLRTTEAHSLSTGRGGGGGAQSEIKVSAAPGSHWVGGRSFGPGAVSGPQHHPVPSPSTTLGHRRPGVDFAQEEECNTRWSQE